MRESGCEGLSSEMKWEVGAEQSNEPPLFLLVHFIFPLLCYCCCYYYYY